MNRKQLKRLLNYTFRGRFLFEKMKDDGGGRSIQLKNEKW